MSKQRFHIGQKVYVKWAPYTDLFPYTVQEVHSTQYRYRNVIKTRHEYKMYGYDNLFSEHELSRTN